jgi:hypothetical protein
LGSEGWRQETGGKHQVKMTKPGFRPITLPALRRQAYSKRFEAQPERELRSGRNLNGGRPGKDYS